MLQKLIKYVDEASVGPRKKKRKIEKKRTRRIEKKREEAKRAHLAKEMRRRHEQKEELCFHRGALSILFPCLTLYTSFVICYCDALISVIAKLKSSFRCFRRVTFLHRFQT